MEKKVELVCFDLGGVLVRLVRGWEHAVEVAGVKLPSREELAGGWERHHEHAVALEVGMITEEEYEGRVRECFPGIDCAGYWRAFDAWLMGLYPGVGDLIADIKASGRKTGVLSNTNARHWRVVTQEYTPIATIDHVLASHLIGCRKPEGEAYRHVERESGVAGGGILFFDDRAENVEAARVAGWQAELIDPTRDGVVQIREILRGRGVLSGRK